MLLARFFRFLSKNFKKRGQVGVIFYGLRKFPGPKKLGRVFFEVPRQKSKEVSQEHWFPLNSPTFDTSNLKIDLQLWAIDVPNHFYGLKKYSQKMPIEIIKKHVSSTVQWSGLGFSYDDLSEELSAAHQLKDVVLKTLIFK